MIIIVRSQVKDGDKGTLLCCVITKKVAFELFWPLGLYYHDSVHSHTNRNRPLFVSGHSSRLMSLDKDGRGLIVEKTITLPFPLRSREVSIVNPKYSLILRHRQVVSWSELERTPS